MPTYCAPRRQFRLPEADEDFLDDVGCPWETILEGPSRWLILRGYALPPGYTQKVVDLAVLIAPMYPPGALDMAYVFPWLQRVDGRPIPQTQIPQMIEGRSWQRWSRHRTQANPWMPGEDDLASHVHYAQSWFAAEFERS